MALKYKAGDQVRIKSIDWYNENKNNKGIIVCGSESFTHPMSHFCNEVVNIITIQDNCYRILEDDGDWYWTDEMIECKVEEETKPKFKVGDKVILDPYPCVVTDVTWRDSLHGFVYTVRGFDFGKMVGEEDLIFDTSEEETYDFLKTDKPNRPSLNDFMDMLDNKIKLPEGYVFKDENGNVINTNKIVLEKKKKEYPKTYEECCKVLSLGEDGRLYTKGYKASLIQNFQKLLICRDAYWKIYGEENGLGKPWEPDWSDYENIKYIIGGYDGEIGYDQNHHIHKILAFPTEEMRDAFYENFKEEIEICKELL